MTILVLGHLVLDEIHTIDGPVYESAGGIAFPLLSFASVAGGQDRLVPVFPVGGDAAGIVDDLLRGYPTIDRGELYHVNDPATRVALYHESRSRYNTRLVSALPPISPERFGRALAAADLVYLNMMTGSDLLPEHAPMLKAPGRLVYIDLHMIAYQVRHDGLRIPAASPWEAWVRAADVLQGNADEFQALFATDDEEAIMRRIFEAGQLRAVVVTHGEAGAAIWLPGGERVFVDAVRQPRTVDPTGCGDTFGSVFAYHFASGAPVGEAAAAAAHAASFVAGIPGSLGMRGLRAHMESRP